MLRSGEGTAARARPALQEEAGRQGPDCQTWSHRVTFLFLSSSSRMSPRWVHPLLAYPWAIRMTHPRMEALKEGVACQDSRSETGQCPHNGSG